MTKISTPSSSSTVAIGLNMFDSEIANMPTAKVFKPFAGVTAKEVTAKLLAAKATKNMGVAYTHFAVEGGFSVKAVVVATPPKKTGAMKGAWVPSLVARVREMGATTADLVFEEGKRIKLVVHGKTVTWFTKREYADMFLAAF